MLAGCASTAPQSHTTVGAYQDTMSRAGRLSVNYDRDGKLETLSGKFAWTQKPGVIDVALMSPIGQTIATISVTPQLATLTQSDGKARTASDIDTLTGQALGWSLPVNGLRDWMQGYATVAGGKRFAGRAVQVGNHHAGAFACQTPCRGRAQTRRASGNQECAAAQFHGCLLISLLHSSGKPSEFYHAIDAARPA